MKNLLNKRSVVTLISGFLFAFALFFNTTLSFSSEDNGDTITIENLETAQAQSEDICIDVYCEVTIIVIEYSDGTIEIIEIIDCIEIEYEC